MLYDKTTPLFRFILLTILFLPSHPALTQIGSLDPAFGDNGTVTHPIQERAQAQDLHLNSDGSIDTFGLALTNGTGTSREGAVTTFNADGTLGTSFTSPGFAFGCSPVPRQFNAGTTLDNGKFLVAGHTQTGCGGTPRPFYVFRFNPNGSTTGETWDYPEFNSEIAYVFDLAVQPDGKVVTAGHASTSGFDNSTFDIAFARHNADGSLDADFGDDGEFSLDIGGDQDRLRAVALHDDGRILGAGFTETADGYDFLMVRLNSDGSVDPAFGTAGVVVHDFHGFDDQIFDIAVQGDDRIVVVGRSTAADDSTIRFTVARFLSDGALDTDFADSGIALIDFGAAVSFGNALAIDPGGRIHVAGTTETGADGVNSRDAAVAVLRPDGSLDPAFGSGGITTFDYGLGPIDSAAAIDIDPVAGRIAVAGYSGETDGEGDQFWEIGVARLIGFPDGVFADRFGDF